MTRSGLITALRGSAPLALLSLGSFLGGLLWIGEARSQDAGPQGAVREAPRALDPRDHRIGRLIPDLPYTDINGKSGTLSDLASNKALVIALRESGCPLCKKYGPRLAAIEAAYAERGVKLLYLNISEVDDLADMRKEVAGYGFKGPYVADKNRAIARALGAQRTTDVFVLDAGRTLVYRGAVDDQYGIGYIKDKPQRRYLAEAIDAVLASRDVLLPATSAPGCELGRLEAPKSSEVTWHNRISRIVRANCTECHREGENAPFPLVSYRDVRGYRRMIERVIADKSMPPWFTDPKVGEWKNDRSLSDEDRDDFLAWIKAGAPKGDPKDAMVERKFTEGWRIGKPDAVLTLSREFKVPAEGTVSYKYAPIETDFSEDRWLKSIEIRAGAPEVVHHVLVFIRYPQDHPKAAEQPRASGGLRGYFAGMVPGEGAVTFPPNSAKFLPKGATLVFQIHYTTNGTAVVDRPVIGFRFTEKPRHQVRTRGVANPRIMIPPGAENHKVTARHRLREHTRILSFSPHMHLRGKAYKYEAILPDKRTVTLCNIPRYDFNWQFMYWLREPVDLPAGTVIRCTGWYDNSDKNPANPNSKRTVFFGEQTWDEMMIGYFHWYGLDAKPDADAVVRRFGEKAAKAAPAKPKKPAAPARPKTEAPKPKAEAKKPDAKKKRYFR